MTTLVLQVGLLEASPSPPPCVLGVALFTSHHATACVLALSLAECVKDGESLDQWFPAYKL